MKLKFDVSTQEYVIVNAILTKHVPANCKVWVFGSRAKHQAKFNSDLDLALESTHPILPRTMAELKDALSQSKLPYTVDVLDINAISESFKAIVRAQAVAFPLRRNDKTPALRFPEFSGEWRNVPIGDLFSWVNTNSLSREMLTYEKGEIQNIHYGDIHSKFRAQFKQSQECAPYIIPNALKQIPNDQFCQIGDLVIADASEDYADIGKSIEIIEVKSESLVAGLHTCIARPINKQLAVGFSGYLFRTSMIRKQIMRIAQGISVLGISKGNLAKLNLSLPHQNEQQKIAGFLGAVDEKIAALKRKQELLEAYKKGVMQQLFSQTLRFTRPDGMDFPEWEEKRLGDVFEVTRGNVLAMPLVSEIKTESHIYPVYSSQTKNNGLAGYYHEYLFENSITWTTDGANAGETNYRDGKFYCTNVCGVLKNSQGFANTFMAELINSVSKKYVSYVGNPKLMNGVMASIKLELPHPDEQKLIADFLTSIDTKIDAVKGQITYMEAFKKGLLQHMFVCDVV